MTKINSKLFPKKSSELARSSELAQHPCNTFKNFEIFFLSRKFSILLVIQGCWANSDGANSDDRANSDDFLGKSLELIFVIIPTFSQILAT